MASRRKTWAARSVVAILSAVLAHVVGLTLFWFFGGFSVLEPFPASQARAFQSAAGRDTPVRDEDRPMQIETIVNQLDRPDEKTPEEKRREEEAKKEEDQKNPHGQVVDIARPVIEERPDKANFVAEYDSKVD